MATHIVVHDIHHPKVDKPTLNALLHFLSENDIDGFTFGGDQFDFECISHHTKGKALYRTAGAYKLDVSTFDKQVLSPIEKAIGSKAARIWHIGNHERFEDDFIEEHPELQGTIDHVSNLGLLERRWVVRPLGHSSKIGKLNVIHGEILTGIGNQAGMYPSRKAVELYSGSVLAGHTHAPQSFTKIAPVEHVQKHMGFINAILGRVNPTYLRNRPTAWLNGFSIVEVGAGGNFNLYTVIVTAGSFCYGGRTYGTKRIA
jgi:hypothetical protein